MNNVTLDKILNLKYTKVFVSLWHHCLYLYCFIEYKVKNITLNGGSDSDS